VFHVVIRHWTASSMDLQALSLSAVMIAGGADPRLAGQTLGEFGEPRRETGRAVNDRVGQLG
jgi:hypothetical protein